MKHSSSKAGFTLIELLVVIAIIGILASIILASLNSATVKGRDTKRMSDLKQFQTALELYYDSHGNYPYTNCSGSNNWTSFDSPTYSSNLVCNTVGGAGQTLTLTMATYIGKLADPRSLGGDSGYLYRNNAGANDYCILFYRTPENLNDFPANYVDPLRCTTWNGAGQCTSSAGTNAIYIGAGTYSGGC